MAARGACWRPTPAARAPQPLPGYVLLDLRGVRELKLVDTDAGDGNFFDHADWAGMHITCSQ